MNPFKDECLSSTLSPFRPNWVAKLFLPAPALALQSRTSPGQPGGEAEERGGETSGERECLCVCVCVCVCLCVAVSVRGWSFLLL